MDKQIAKIEKRFKYLESQLGSPTVAAHHQQLTKYAREHKRLAAVLTIAHRYQDLQKELAATEKMATQETDPDLRQLAATEAPKLKKQLAAATKKLQLALLPPDPFADRNIILEIRAGAGGEEAGLFAADLFRMYSHYAERGGAQTNLLSASRTGIGGFKEAIMEIKGEGVYPRFKFESGVHRVQRIPTTEKSGRVHTSTATVAVLPEAEEIDLNIKTEDLRVDVYRSSGPGGQSVNTTDSAVRITHLPTNTVVTVQDEKSQMKNKEKALRILRSRILAAEQEKQMRAIAANRRGQIGTGERSEKVRTYNFPQDRLTDHRVKQSWHGLEKILAGELAPIVRHLTEAENKIKLESQE